MNRALIVVLLSRGAAYLTLAMFGPIYAAFVSQVGGGVIVAGSSFGLFAFVSGLVEILIARYSNRVRETELVVVLGYFLLAFGFFGYIFISQTWHIYAIQAILGVASAIAFPVVDTLFSRHVDKKKDVVEWSFWEVSEDWTTALGATVGGFIAGIFGFTFLFIIMGTIMIVNALFIFFLPRKLL